MLSKKNAKPRVTAPRTYMSAAGLQSEIAPETLAQLACHDAKYKVKVDGLRTEIERKVINIQQDQRGVHRTLVAIKKRQKSIAKSKAKQKALPPISLDSQLPSEASQIRTTPMSPQTTDKSRQSSLTLTSAGSSTRVNLGTPKLSHPANRKRVPPGKLIDDFILDTLEDRPQDTIFPEPRFITREDVILEESEPESSEEDDVGQQSPAKVEQITPRNNVDDTPRSKMSEVSLTGLKINLPSSNKTDDQDQFLTPRSNITPRKARPNLDSSASFMKLVRLQQSNGLSKSLALVDQFARPTKKLPSLLDGSKSQEDISTILANRQPKERSFIYGRDVQSDLSHQSKEKRVQLKLRGYSDTKDYTTKGPILQRTTKELTPFRRVSIVNEHKTEDPDLSALDMHIPGSKESSFVKTKTWLHNSSLEHHDNNALHREGTFGSDADNELTPSPRLLHHQRPPHLAGLVKNEPMLNSARGNAHKAEKEHNLTDILSQQYRRTTSKNSMRNPSSRLDHLRDGISPLYHAPSRDNLLDGDSRITPRVNNANQMYAAQNLVTDKHNGENHDGHDDISPSHLLSPRKQHPHHDTVHDENGHGHDAETRSRLDLPKALDHRHHRDRHRGEDIAKVLRDERRAIAKADIQHDDIKWRKKLARVKEVHFLGSGNG